MNDVPPPPAPNTVGRNYIIAVAITAIFGLLGDAIPFISNLIPRTETPEYPSSGVQAVGTVQARCHPQGQIGWLRRCIRPQSRRDNRRRGAQDRNRTHQGRGISRCHGYRDPIRSRLSRSCAARGKRALLDRKT